MNLSVLRLLLRPAPGHLGSLLIPASAFAIVSALILTVVGGAQAFWRWDDEYAMIYQLLAVIALVLLVVPLGTLGGAAARLSARRRDERLSTLRLLGVTPVGVGAIAIVESTLIAALGVVVGVAVSYALVPAIALIPFRGAPLGIDAILLSPLAVAGIAVGTILLATVSAVLGLRQVAISPLGVRIRATPPRMHWIRLLAAVIVVAAGVVVAKLIPGLGGMLIITAVLGGLFAVVLLVLNLLGPWVLQVVARRQARTAKTPERLLAARLVLDFPKAAWRQVSGIAMSSFMAVFAGTGVSLMNTMGTSDATAQDVALITDMRTGLIITLVASFLMVAASVGVTQASDVLDKDELHRSLHYLGVPLGTVDAARRRAIMSPLLLTALGSALCAAALILPLLGIAMVTAPLSVLTIALVLAAGIGVVWLGTRVTRPMLARAFAG